MTEPSHQTPMFAGRPGEPLGVWRTSFAGKVAGLAVLIVVGALLVSFGSFIHRDWRVERESMVERRTAIASVIAANISSPLIFKDRATAHDILISARGVPNVEGVLLLDDEGRIFARDGEATAVATEARTPVWRFGHSTLAVHVPVLADGERLGELVLVSSLHGLHATFMGYAMFAGLVFVTVAGLALWAALALTRRIMEPVNRLSTTMRAVRESGDFDRPVEPAPDAELARLAHEFNALLAELARRNAALMSARDEAEAANRTKTEFLANMSHELRTPLNAVLGLSPLLAAEPLTRTQRDYLGVIESSATTLLDLLNDVLDIANLESGRLVLQPVRFDLVGLMQETCAVFAALAHGKGLAFTLEHSDDLAQTYVGDPVRLKQIVTNLVSNAVKFTPTGQVTVSIGRAADDPDMIRVHVADTGIGISEEKLPVLFDKFVQADLSTTRRYGGTGLGLAICRDLAQLMGGDIEVASRPGEGSVFTASLILQPLASTPGASRDAAREAA